MMNDLLKKELAILPLNIKTHNALFRVGLRTVGDVATKGEFDLLMIKGIARGSLNQIKEALANLNLKLNTEVERHAPSVAELHIEYKKAIEKLEKDLFECNKLRSEAYGTNQELRSNVEAYKKELKNSNEYVRRLFDMLETEMKRGSK